VLPWIAISLPYARKDGLAANAGRPDGTIAAVAAAIALAIAILVLPFGSALLAAIAACAGALIMALLAKRQIGGQTGDVLGAIEQGAETAVLLAAAAWS
jgi:adenosylcobinamide-GDP ribazoletransferase